MQNEPMSLYQLRAALEARAKSVHDRQLKVFRHKLTFWAAFVEELGSPKELLGAVPPHGIKRMRLTPYGGHWDHGVWIGYVDSTHQIDPGADDVSLEDVAEASVIVESYVLNRLTEEKSRLTAAISALVD